MSSIQSAIAGLQAAGNIAQAMIDLRDAAIVKAKVIELQSAILAAQSSALAAHSEQFALLERVRNLETQVAQMEAWEKEKERYQLTDVGNGKFAYALKESAQPPEPPHHICANCYNRREKSILQPEVKAVGRARVLACHNCGAEIYTSGMRLPEHGQIVIKGRRS